MRILNLFVIGAGALFFAATAQAIVMPGFERPVYRAEMQVDLAQGSLLQTETIVLTRFKVDDSRTSGFKLDIDGEMVKFFVERKENIGCGSVRYYASSYQVSGALNQDYYMIEVTDHMFRLCDDLPASLIKIDMRHYRAPLLEPTGVLSASGTAEFLYTIQ